MTDLHGCLAIAFSSHGNSQLGNSFSESVMRLFVMRLPLRLNGRGTAMSRLRQRARRRRGCAQRWFSLRPSVTELRWGAFGELRAVLNRGNPQLVAEAEAFMVSLLNQLNLGEQQGHQQQPLESSAPPPPPPPPPPQQQQPLPQSSYGPDSLQTAFVGTVRLLVF